MQNNQFLENLKNLKEATEKTLKYNNMLDNKKKEEYLRTLEKIRYEIFETINFENKYSENESVDYINKHYTTEEKQGILRIIIPEVLPKFKNVSNSAYKNIMLNVAEVTKQYKNMFNDKLTFVMIIVHEKQKNSMDIDNKYVKPIIDALVMSKVIKDDNFSNMFYSALGKSDTTKPYTEVFVLEGTYLLEWICNMQKLFKNCPI